MANSAISSILSFASNLNISSLTLIPDLRARIPLFPVEDLPHKHRKDFETKGTELWNLARRQSRDVRDDAIDHGAHATKVALLRAFAFGLLDTVASSRNQQNRRASTCSRVLNVALKALKACVDASELEFASKVATRAASWLDEAKHILPDDSFHKVNGEYLIWRLALAWRQDKLDLAEHLYKKFREHSKAISGFAEDLADVLYELGKSLHDRRQFEPATTWLDRALDAIDAEELDRLSDDASDLKLAILQALVKSLLSIKTTDAIEKAKRMVDMIENSYSNKLIAQVIRLEVLSAEQSPSPADMFDAITQMVRATMLSRENFKTIMHHIHKLKESAPELACKVLDELIVLRLREDTHEEWIERACMLRLWITVSPQEQTLDDVALTQLLNDLHELIVKPLSTAACYAALALLWNHIEKMYSSKQYSTCETYCALAFHELFKNSGEMNRGRIGRKWMLSALARADGQTAREIYFRLPESQRNLPETRYLAFKAALRMNDSAWAAESLEAVAKHVNQDATRLYACVLDAIQMQENQQAYEALNKLLAKYEEKPINGVHLPALLRSMIRLIEKSKPDDLGNEAAKLNQYAEELCALFEVVAKKVNTSGQAKTDFTTAELNWFSKNCYNLAVAHMDTIDLPILRRLCLSCIVLTGKLEHNTPASEKGNLLLRHVFCEYLAMTIDILLARREDDIMQSHEYYAGVVDHGKSLRGVVGEAMDAAIIKDTIKTDLISKHIQAVKFELEASLRLQQWNALPELFEQCWKYDDPKQWSTLADLAFSIHTELCDQSPDLLPVHERTVLLFVQKVVHNSWKPSEPVDRLAKHLRCLFHLVLGKENDLAALCIDQIIDVAKQCKSARRQYPQAELEWIAATTFNHAVTSFCHQDDATCQLWAEKALIVAGLMDDKKALANEISKKYSQLRLNGQNNR